MTAPARIKQQDMTRIMKGARKAGFSRVRVAIDLRGNIVIEASDEVDEPVRINPLDRLLGNR